MKLSPRAREIAEWSALAALGAAGFFNMFTPSTFDIKHELAEHDGRRTLRDLRSSYLQAAIPSGILAGIVSVVAGSPVPILATAATSGLMVGIYESAVDEGERLICLHRTPRIPHEIAPPGPDYVEAAPGSWRRVES